MTTDNGGEKVISFFKEIEDFCNLEIPEEFKVPIAIIGAGGIVDGAHLPAYRKANLQVVGITDVNLEKAKEVAKRNGIAEVYSSVEEMLDKSGATIIDIAVPSKEQPSIFFKVAESRHHILAQKPLAPTPELGRQMAEKAKEFQIIAGVNQQLRFEEGIAAAYKMVELGWIGEVTNFTISVNLVTPWELWPWAKELPRLEIMIHSIHYHDVVRWFLGEPKSVFCVAGRTKGQYPKGETRTISTYVYEGGLTALVHANHINRGGDNIAEFRIDGDKGSIRGTLGLLYDYPIGRLDTLEINSQVIPTDGWTTYPVTQRWFPDAFMGTMGSVMTSIATGAPLRSSIDDNVKTLDLIAALYESIESGKAIELHR